MSVLIKGMEMPKNCAVCRLEKDLFGRAVCFGYEDGRALHKDDLPPVGNEERRPSWCPLVPVPPHGRLIDADAEIEVWDVCGKQGVFPHFTTTVSKFLLGHLVGKIPPTIIEAEEGE